MVNRRKVHLRRDSSRKQVGAHASTDRVGDFSAELHYVHEPASFYVFWMGRKSQLWAAGEKFGILASDVGSRRQYFVNALELGQSKRCLDIVQTIVVTNPHMLQPCGVGVSALIP